MTVRPLRQISGDANFNEVFFDDLEVAEDATVGPVDGGWGVSMTTLMFERMMVLAALEELPVGAETFVAPLLDNPALEDPHVRQRLADLAVERIALQYTAYRALTELAQGQIPGPEAGLGKIGVMEAGPQGLRARRRRTRPGRARGRVGRDGGRDARACARPAARRRSCATRSASACSACRPSRASTRTDRSAS